MTRPLAAMLVLPALLSCCATLHVPPARADVAWEHTATVRLAPLNQPGTDLPALAKLKIYNHWTPQRHRLLINYAIPATSAGMIPGGLMPPTDMTGLAATPAARATSLYQVAPPASAATNQMSAPGPTTVGSLAFIERLDDDRVIAYESQSRSYVSERRRPLLRQLRFDPWKQIAPRLSRETPPALSMQQRARLGAELRVVTAPYLRRVWRVYFHRLPAARTFRDIEGRGYGVEGRGYRMAWLINVGGMDSRQEQWARVTMEWWLAGELPGDYTVRQFRATWLKSLQGAPSTTSMWANEFWPVLLQALPQELQSAARTLVPPPSSPRAGFGGTPLRIYLTVVPPPLQRSQTGDVRMEIALTGHDTGPWPTKIFQAPDNYKRVPLDPKTLNPNLEDWRLLH